MRQLGGQMDAWTWTTRVATWGAVALAAALTLAALLDWTLPSELGGEMWVPLWMASIVFAGAVSSAQKRWTCVSAVLFVFAIGMMVAGTANYPGDVTAWSSTIEPATLSIDGSFLK